MTLNLTKDQHIMYIFFLLAAIVGHLLDLCVIVVFSSIGIRVFEFRIEIATINFDKIKC